MDKGRSKNLTTSLILCFFFIFYDVVSSETMWFLKILIVYFGLIIDDLNNIINNPDRFVFLEYQIGTPIG